MAANSFTPTGSDDPMPTPVTLNDVLYWDPIVGAAGYQVRVRTAASGPFWPSTTDANMVQDVGLATEFALADALVGAPAGQYKVDVRAVEAGGANPTPFGTEVVDLTGLATPGPFRLTP